MSVPVSAPVDPVSDYDSQLILELVAAAVPLSLLIDLVLPTPSSEILAHEGGDARWMIDVA